MNWMAQALHDLENLVFPAHCAVCNATLRAQEQEVCLYCLHQLILPELRKADQDLRLKPGFQDVYVHNSWVLMAFVPGGHSQHLIHLLKYGNRPTVGHVLGSAMGQLMSQQWQESPPTMVVPVPLHASRQRHRGYNQAAMIAHGIAATTGLPVVEAVLLRPHHTESQVNKNRSMRLANMRHAFAVEANMEGEHVLLVDDVLTTGATLGSCAEQVALAGAHQISIAVLATAG